MSPAEAMHPTFAEAYRRNMTRIAEALNGSGMKAGDARRALRSLVELVTAEPRSGGRGLALVVQGRLAQILHIANDRLDAGRDSRMRNVVAEAGSTAKQREAPEGADCMKRLVAGTGFEPVTFRL